MHWPPHPGDLHRSRVGPHVPGEIAPLNKRRRNLALMTLCLAMTLSGLDMATINVALPSLARDLGATTSELQWIVDSYTITLAGLILLGNGLADRFGRRRAFVAGMTLFALGTLTAAFSTSTIMLIGTRSIMGVGAALVLGPAMSLIAVIFPVQERGRALGIWSLFAALGIAFGPVIGGILLSRFWWGSVFLATVPVCVLGIIGGLAFLPESVRPDNHKLDVIGAALSVAGLGTLLFGVIEGPDLGFSSPLIIAALVVGGVLLAGFIMWELRNPHPMFDPRIFRIGAVTGGTLTIFMIYIAFVGMQFIIPQWLQLVDNRSPLTVGLMMMPISGALGVVGIFGPRIAARYGTRRVLLAAMTTQLVGLSILSLIGRYDSYLILLIGGVITGLALGVSIAPGTAVVMNALPEAKVGDGSGANQLARQVGSAVSVAVLGSLVASGYRQAISPATASLTPAQASTSIAHLSGAVATAAQLGGSAASTLLAAAGHAFADGAQIAFAFAAALSAVTLVVIRRTVTGAADQLVIEDVPEDTLDDVTEKATDPTD